MSIEIERQGLFDTIQDAGRPGYRACGVPSGGWFDAWHAGLANALAGNDPGEPCIEITQASGLFRVRSDCVLNIVGPGAAIYHSTVDGQRNTYRNSVSFPVRSGDSVEIYHPEYGLRSYVAISGGGWFGEKTLGSYSSEHRLKPGQLVVPRYDMGKLPIKLSHVRFIDHRFFVRPSSPVVLRYLPAGEFVQVSSDATVAQAGVLSGVWKVSVQSNRVGLRFHSDGSEERKKQWPVQADRLSEPVVPGAIQWTGEELLVLGVAGGTMGGYPVAGYLFTGDMNGLAQLRPGTNVRFEPVSLSWAREEARKVANEQARILSRIRAL